MMIHYQKLVRDKIPDLIRQQGANPVIRILDDEEYSRCLHLKLDEEIAEFHKENNLEELADILEVIFALTEDLGESRDKLMNVYQEKHDQRGGFAERVFLISKTDKCL